MRRALACVRGALALLVFLTAPLVATATECHDTTYENLPYTICKVAAGEDLRLFLRGKNGAILGNFAAVEGELSGARLAFAMNAGMYHTDRRPVGYYLENGRQFSGLSDGGGYGNFGLLPNGVFCISDRLQVWESHDFAQAAPPCRFATQSGPMLVVDGELHPAFMPNGTSRYIRNGVGTSSDGRTAYFVISNFPVTFHEFGSLFRNHLAVPNALFLDGNVSRLYAPSLGRADFGAQMGPIVGVVADAVTGAVD